LAGHTVTHGALSQCMQGIGIRSMLKVGYLPWLAAITLCQKGAVLRLCSSGEPCGTLFSALQAMVHDWQPVHLSRSMTIPHLAIYYLMPCRR
jgi:hypothetical protein